MLVLTKALFLLKTIFPTFQYNLPKDIKNYKMESNARNERYHIFQKCVCNLRLLRRRTKGLQVKLTERI